MHSAHQLRRKLSEDAPVVGALVSSHLWLELVEISIQSGLDYLIIDAEHFDHGASLIADACALARQVGFPVLLRPARTDPDSIRIAMDLGPCGLLLPMIESAAQMDGVREGLYLPPRGRRRPGGPANRWVNKYDYETFRREVEDSLIVIPQIESRQGLANVTAIASHPIVTAVGVGPFDLSADLGVCWMPDDPMFQNALRSIRQAADTAGKRFWMIGDMPQLVRQGVQFVCMGDPAWLLQKSLGDLVSSTRKSQGATTPAASRGN